MKASRKISLSLVLAYSCLALLMGIDGHPGKDRLRGGDYPSHSPEERPHIVILLADDLGYGDLACYGNKEIRSPNLDRLASQGIRFIDAYASAPMCSILPP